MLLGAVLDLPGVIERVIRCHSYPPDRSRHFNIALA